MEHKMAKRQKPTGQTRSSTDKNLDPKCTSKTRTTKPKQNETKLNNTIHNRTQFTSKTPKILQVKTTKWI